ncbi:hypothetical protein ACOSP6_10090 [Tenacibaculum sp. MEBiC06402]|uniref:hypothetical protein n=1 Tax=unclassified Tenacibaculum TaxID=2635139 RepID=UPI003B994B9E
MELIKIILFGAFLFLGTTINTITSQKVVTQNKTEFLEENLDDVNTIKVLKHSKVVKKNVPSQKKHIDKVVSEKDLKEVLKRKKYLRFRNKRHQKNDKCYRDDVCGDKELDLDRNKIKRAQ